MGIKELTAAHLGKKKPSEWRFDKNRELWVTYQVRVEFNGEPHVRRGFLTEDDAKIYLDELVFQERLREIGAVQPIKFPTVKKLFDAHLLKIKSKKARRTAKRVFNKFLSLLPRGIRLDALKRKHFVDFCDRRISEDVKAETAHREITYISSALHKAGDYFENLENWNVPEKLIYRPAVSDHGRDRIISRDERSSLIKYLLRDKQSSESEKSFTARRRTGLIFYFGLLTGLRHGEISGLEKINFDPALRRLKAERFKTRNSGVRWTVFEPLTDTQAWILNEGKKLYPDGEFFFSEKGKSHNKFYEIMEAACVHLKIEYGKSNPNGFIMHDTRHTFVTVLEHGAVDSSTTRSFSGHSKDSMLKRYAHATPDSRFRAMQIIERELGLEAGEDLDDKLKEVFDLAQNRAISFEQFKKSFYGFLTKNIENDVADVADVNTLNSGLIQ